MPDHPRNNDVHAISFTPETDRIVKAKAAQLQRPGETKPNRSLAVRAIILEWAAMTGFQATDPTAVSAPKKSRKKS